MSCRHNIGGLMNVRNSMLNCIRYAIAAGVSGLVLPKLEIRDSQDLSILRTGNYRNMDYYYDIASFKTVMQASCNQLKLFDEIEDIKNFGYANMPDLIHMHSLMGQYNKNWRNQRPDKFRQKFDGFIQALSKPPSEKSPVIVRLDDKILFSFPPHDDVPHLAQNFGFILDFRQDLSSLAALILNRLRRTLAPDIEQETAAKQYLGLHLRTEYDAMKEEWLSYDKLKESTIFIAMEHNIDLIYVASGEIQDIEKLRDSLSVYGMTVMDKWQLLTADETEYLQSFAFDQQGIVDYLVLLQSDMFLGSPESSFSSNLVLRRNLIASDAAIRDGRVRAERSRLADSKAFRFADMQWP
ncbi:hypothetical protein ABW21_db0201191 [Orbilia brochopaga]|nr:hypothetical protein ABW21_db0201191 [Drechslerella brochopaga]